jgi:D-serine deaminase-like pyridoxal phosphate-dependent protein
MARRADGTPIRLASKSVRCRRIISDTLGIPGFRGILAFTLPEALWLAECRTSDHIVVAYPTADQAALGAWPAARRRPRRSLFDAYRSFSGLPAAVFALPVVRRPGSGVATVLGGGYLASGPGNASRIPRPYLPAGLKLDRNEGAGEVQTPVVGRAADGLRIGDRVWFRHAKAGELCERFNELHLIEGSAITETVQTYRGEGKAFG